MATYYWVNGSGFWDSSSTANWSLTSGVVAPAGPPTSADTVVFNASSGAGTVNIFSGATCLDLTASLVPATTLFWGGTSVPVAVYGSVNFGANATFTNAAISLNMLATTTGKTVTISNTTIVNDITYSGVGGAWTQSASTVLNGNPSITVNAGSVTFSGAIVTNYVQVNGGTLTTGSLTHSIRSSNGDFGKFEATAGTVNLTGTVLNIGTTLPAATVSNGNTFSVASGVTLTVSAASRVTLGTATAGTTAINYFYGGGKTYGIVDLLGQENTVTGANTFTGNFTCTGVNIINTYLAFGANQTFQAGFTAQGNTAATYRLSMTSDTAGTSRTLAMSSSVAASKVLKWADVADIAFNITGTTALAGTLAGNCGGNSMIAGASPFLAGISCYARTGTTAYNWSNTNMWYTANTGGSLISTVGSRVAPLAQDNVFFSTNAGTGVVTADVQVLGTNLDFTSWPGTSLAAGVGVNVIYGTLTSPSNAFALSGNLVFGTRTTGSITVPTIASGSFIFFSNPGATITLGGAVTQTIALFPLNGTFSTGNFALTIQSFYVKEGYQVTYFYNGGGIIKSGPLTVNLGSSLISLTGAWNSDAASATLNADTSTISLNAASMTMRGSNNTFNALTFNQNGPQTAALLCPGCTFNSITYTTSATKNLLNLTIGASQTITVGSLNLTAAKAQKIFVSVSGTSNANYQTQATLALTSAASTNFVAYRGINRTGTGTLQAYGVADLGNNSNIDFASPVKAIAFTGNIGSARAGSFTVPTDFSGSSLLVAVGGGGGGGRRTTAAGTGGGGSGGLSVSSNSNITAGQTIYYSAGSGGAGATTTTGAAGGNGTASWINISANSSPAVATAGAAANFGSGSGSSVTTGGTAATAGVGNYTYTGTVGGTGSSTTGGGGASAPSIEYRGGLGASTPGTTGTAGGAGGGGQKTAGSTNSTTTGGAGGQNLSASTAAGGTSGNAGTAGTLGGGGGGGGSGAAGGASGYNNEFYYVSLNGVASTGFIGSSGGGGGGGANSAGTGGAGGAASIGGGGGGSGRGSVTANNGNGGNGGVGLVMLVYVPTSTGARGYMIG